MENTITIRQGSIDDADRLAEIAVAAWIWAYSSFLPSEFMKTRTEPAKRAQRIRETWDPENLVLVAVDGDGAVCGFASEHRPCSLEGYEAEIGALYVHPDAARNGVGSALVRKMVAEFLARGLQSMAIHTLAQNEIGCRFYEKLGGIRGQEDTWNGYPSVWYVWSDLAIHS